MAESHPCPDCGAPVPPPRYRNIAARRCPPCTEVYNRIAARERSRRRRGGLKRAQPPRALRPGEKWCPACRQIKQRERDFRRYAARPDGRYGWCRQCEGAAQRDPAWLPAAQREQEVTT